MLSHADARAARGFVLRIALEWYSTVRDETLLRRVAAGIGDVARNIPAHLVTTPRFTGK